MNNSTFEEIISKWNEKGFICKTTDEEFVIHKKGYPVSNNLKDTVNIIKNPAL